MSGKKKQMTVGELRTALMYVPAHYKVFTEGCDCVGEARSVDIQKHDKSVMINR